MTAIILVLVILAAAIALPVVYVRGQRIGWVQGYTEGHADAKKELG